MGRLYEASVVDQTYEIAERFMSVIFRDCGPYLREIRGSNSRFLVSGRRSDYSWFEKDVRKDRKPVDIGEELHKDIDVLFRKKFGYPVRSSSIFATTQFDIASTYGKPYLLFPKGIFKFIWSPQILDLYILLDAKADYADIKYKNGIYDVFYTAVENDVDAEKIARQDYNEYLQSVVDMYIKHNFKGALDSGHEIMINCNSYYAVEYSRWHQTFTTFLNYMGNNMPTMEIFKEWFYEVRRK